MKFILGKKIGITRVFAEDGSMIPVTLIEAGPCAVTQVKNTEKDGYKAVQLGFGFKKKISKPMQGHIKKAQAVLGKENEKDAQVQSLREFRLDKKEKEYKEGDKIDVSIFAPGDKIEAVSISKGKGFQGVMKRHNFKGHSASHGTKHAKRQPGSIGSAFPEHVLKGKKMAGRMGGERITSKVLKVVEVDKDKNLLIIKGCIAGSHGAIVEIVSNK